MDYLLDFVRKQRFNAIRLPFSAEMAEKMDTLIPTGIDYKLNPDLKGKTAGQVMDTLIAKCRKRGILVMPEMHSFVGSGKIAANWYNDTEGWGEKRVIEAWKRIVRRYKNEPTVFAIDIKNEPHGRTRWKDWASGAEKVGNAMLAINPRLLIFVEGVEHSEDGGPGWWGGNLADVLKRPIIKLRVANKLVYSPHVYGPDVFPRPDFSEPGFPKNLEKVWEHDFAYLLREHKKAGAPIVIGEWGGRNEHGTKDRVWQEAIAAYFVRKGLGCAQFYWALNPNSGDTGGLLMMDWKTPVEHKLALLRKVCPTPTDILSIPRRCLV